MPSDVAISIAAVIGIVALFIAVQSLRDAAKLRAESHKASFTAQQSKTMGSETVIGVLALVVSVLSLLSSTVLGVLQLTRP